MEVTAFDIEMVRSLMDSGYTDVVVTPRTKFESLVIPFKNYEDALALFESFEEETMFHSAVMEIHEIAEEVFEVANGSNHSYLIEAPLPTSLKQ